MEPNESDDFEARILVQEDGMYINMEDLFVWLATLATSSFLDGKLSEASTIVAVGDVLAAGLPA